MALVGQALPAREIEAALPAVGFTLPQGASLQQGNLNTQMNIAGPIDRLNITGPIALTNAVLAGYDLAGKMGALAAFAGLPHGKDTEIERMGASVHVAPEGIRVDDIAIVAPAIGSLAGHGTIAPGGALDFSMVAKLTGARGVANGLVHAASFGNPEDGVPFKIQGTTADPSFVPDVKAMAGNVVKGSAATTKAAGLLGGSKTATAIGGLLGRKK
jgi:AsmA protein